MFKDNFEGATFFDPEVEKQARFDALVRDLTKIHPQPKSYVRKLLIEFLDTTLKQQASEIAIMCEEKGFIASSKWIKEKYIK